MEDTFESGSDNDVSQVLQMYNEISSACKNCTEIIGKLNSPIQKHKDLGILDVKNDTMLSYLINLIYLMLMKCCGQSSDEIDARERLVELRVILEKIRPLEDKLKYHIEKILKPSVPDQNNELDKSSFRANIANLNSDESDIDEDLDETKQNEAKTKSDNKTAVYKPPKIAAVPYDNDTKAEKQKKMLEFAKRRALNSSIIQELKEEYLDTPLEISNPTTLRNTQSKFRKEKETYEEEFFTRLPASKKEKHRDKLMASLTLGNLGNEITKFEDISALEGHLPVTKKKRKITYSKKKNKGFKKRRTL